MLAPDVVLDCAGDDCVVVDAADCDAGAPPPVWIGRMEETQIYIMLQALV
jgi:hypothetical protein